MGPRSAAGTALLVQSCCMTTAGVLLLLVPGASDLLLASSATRSSALAVKALAQVIGALLVFLAALLCSVPNPSASTCRSVAAGAAVAAVCCARAALSPFVGVAVVVGAAAFFAAVTVTMLALTPQLAAPDNYGPGLGATQKRGHGDATVPSDAASGGKAGAAAKPSGSHARTKQRSE